MQVTPPPQPRLPRGCALLGVPGLAALNKGGNAAVNSVSCVSAGSCLAGGYYQGSGGARGFAAIERNGAWGMATPVLGLAALDKGGRPTTVLSVSCTPAGSCAVGGFYADRARHTQDSSPRPDSTLQPARRISRAPVTEAVA